MEGSVDPVRDIEVLDLELTYSDLTILERKAGEVGGCVERGPGCRRGSNAAWLSWC